MREQRRRRRRSSRWRQGGAGLLLGFSGAGVLLLLMQLPDRLDTILLVSNAVTNLIRGLTLLGLGVMQLAAVLGVVVLALFALLLMVAGGVRMIRAMAPAREKRPDRRLHGMHGSPGCPPAAQLPSRCNQNPASCQLLHRKISRNSQLSHAGR